MVCYRDMTFCNFYKNCKSAEDCHRPLTEEVMFRASIAEIPICQFADKPECHIEKTTGE